MLLRFINNTALISIEWTVQKLNNVDRTPQALQDSATKKYQVRRSDCTILFCFSWFVQKKLIHLTQVHLKKGIQ